MVHIVPKWQPRIGGTAWYNSARSLRARVVKLISSFCVRFRTPWIDFIRVFICRHDCVSCTLPPLCLITSDNITTRTRQQDSIYVSRRNACLRHYGIGLVTTLTFDLWPWNRFSNAIHGFTHRYIYPDTVLPIHILWRDEAIAKYTTKYGRW